MPIDKDKLVGLMIDKKFSQTKLAKEANISKSQISRILKADKPKVRTETLGKIADGLKVDYKELMIKENK